MYLSRQQIGLYLIIATVFLFFSAIVCAKPLIKGNANELTFL